MQGMQQGGMGVPTPPGTMSPYVAPAGANIITTELIQKYLDENKQLILAILDNQNLGKLNECAQYQSRLQQNLMYLAAIADAQPQLPSPAQPAAASPALQPQQYPQQQQQAPQQPMMQQAPQQPMQQMGQPQAMMTHQQQQQPMQYAHPQQFQQQPPAMVPQQQPQPGMDPAGSNPMIAGPNGAPGYAVHQAATSDGGALGGVPHDGASVHAEAQHFEIQQQLPPHGQEQPQTLGPETGVPTATVEGDQTHAT